MAYIVQVIDRGTRKTVGFLAGVKRDYGRWRGFVADRWEGATLFESSADIEAAWNDLSENYRVRHSYESRVAPKIEPGTADCIVAGVDQYGKTAGYLSHVVMSGTTWPTITTARGLATKYPTPETALADWERLPPDTKSKYNPEIIPIPAEAPAKTPPTWSPDPIHSHGKRVAWVRGDGVGLTFDRAPPTRADDGTFRPAYLSVWVWSSARVVLAFAHFWPDRIVFHPVKNGCSASTRIVSNGPHTTVEALIERVGDAQTVMRLADLLETFDPGLFSWGA